MNNEKYNQIIDEAYKNYSKEYEKDNSIGMTLLVRRVDGKSVYRKPDRERFVTMCTYDKTFSEKWELKIEERGLSSQERKNLYDKSSYTKDIFPTNENGWNSMFDGNKIPTKIITVTYKDEKIEIYE